MKQGSFRAVRRIVFLLVMLSITVFTVFGDENTVDYRSLILENFNGENAKHWEIGGKVYDYEFEWALDSSKFASRLNNESFPKQTLVEAWPMQVWGLNKHNLDVKSLGVWGKFDRRGYNWIDVYPVVPGTGGDGEAPEAFEIPIPGRMTYMDLWVWGSNLNYYLEVYLRDHQGVVYNLYMGNLGFQGWKNLRVQIPTSIRQSKRILPHLAGLHLVKFRIWTTPMERVDNFYVYFNQLKVLTDTFETLYDGDDLADPDHVQEIWAKK